MQPLGWSQAAGTVRSQAQGLGDTPCKRLRRPTDKPTNREIIIPQPKGAVHCFSSGTELLTLLAARPLFRSRVRHCTPYSDLNGGADNGSHPIVGRL